MRTYSAREIADCVAARLAQEYPAAVFSASPVAINQRVNQQATGPGGRIVMVPSGVAKGKPMLSGPLEAFADNDTYTFYCYGWAADSQAWADQYTRAQELGDVIKRAFYPFMTRIQFTAGATSGDQQTNQTGAQIAYTYTVRRPIKGELGPDPSDAHDGGSTDVSRVEITALTTEIEAIR